MAGVKKNNKKHAEQYSNVKFVTYLNDVFTNLK